MARGKSFVQLISRIVWPKQTLTLTEKARFVVGRLGTTRLSIKLGPSRVSLLSPAEQTQWTDKCLDFNTQRYKHVFCCLCLEIGRVSNRRYLTVCITHSEPRCKTYISVSRKCTCRKAIVFCEHPCCAD